MIDFTEKIRYEKPKAIVLKIFGVLVPNSFAKYKLMDYSIENCYKYLDVHFFEPNVLKLIPKIKKFYETFIIDNSNCPVVQFDEFCEILKIQNEIIRKKLFDEKSQLVNDFKTKLTAFLIYAFQHADSTSPVNELQNLIWEDGYLSNRLKSEFYDDVPSKLQKWREMNIRLFTFSSGTVHAQQIILQNSVLGNLLQYIDGQISGIYLDKKDTSCYNRIAEIINEERKSILLISGSISEIKAASVFGFKICLIRRRDRRPDFDEQAFRQAFNIAHNLNDLIFSERSSLSEHRSLI